MCHALFRAEWKDIYAQKNGRSGQPQNGVDIFGSPDGFHATFHGVQCKGKDQTYGGKPTLPELKQEIEKAEGFTPPLEHWVFATTAPVDDRLQRAAREISRSRKDAGKFTVSVLGWEQIQSLLADHPRIVETFYPEHAFDLRGIIAALKELPRGEDIRSILALWRNSRIPSSPAPAWTPVHFDSGRDLGPALMGRPLGVRDVTACPLLPEAHTVIKELERAFAARILGEPGSGKTVCAPQAAHILASGGWRVVRLFDSSVEILELTFDDVPTLHIVDDAQLASPHAINAAEESTGPAKLLLTVHNAIDRSGFGPGTIRLDLKRAVHVIAAGLRANMKDTLNVVRRVDDRVGDRPGDESLELRLKHAEEVADRPWQFCFILGGGWRRAGQAADNSRSKGADIALAAAGIRQIASRDALCKRYVLLSLLSSVGVEPAEGDRALDWLINERLVNGPEDLRPPHQRFAAVVVRRILEGRTPKVEKPSGKSFIRYSMTQSCLSQVCAASSLSSGSLAKFTGGRVLSTDTA